MTRPTLCLLALLTGCQSYSVEATRPDGSTLAASGVRVWTDTSIAVSGPDGLSIQYSSDADAAQPAALTNRLLDVVLPPQFKTFRQEPPRQLNATPAPALPVPFGELGP